MNNLLINNVLICNCASTPLSDRLPGEAETLISTLFISKLAHYSLAH
jgi:hypothetical protein